MKKISINYQSLCNLTDTEHYELHHSIYGIIEECKKDIPDIISVWNIYYILFQQERNYYKLKCQLNNNNISSPDDIKSLLTSYQLIYMRKKVDNLFLTIIELINTLFTTNKLTFQEEETYKNIIDSIHTHLIEIDGMYILNEHTETTHSEAYSTFVLTRL